MADNLLDDNVELYPPWKQALERFRAASFQYGDLVPHEWFWQAFGIAAPSKDTPWSEAQRLQLLFLSQFKPFQEALLEDDQIDLVNERSRGYVLIPPQEQAKQAYQDYISDLKSSTRKLARRTTNVNLALLSAEARREHTDYLTRIARIGAMTKAIRQLPMSGDEDE